MLGSFQRRRFLYDAGLGTRIKCFKVPIVLSCEQAGTWEGVGGLGFCSLVICGLSRFEVGGCATRTSEFRGYGNCRFTAREWLFMTSGFGVT